LKPAERPAYDKPDFAAAKTPEACFWDAPRNYALEFADACRASSRSERECPGLHDLADASNKGTCSTCKPNRSLSERGMFFERLTPPIEVDTPDGRGWAIFLRDYGWDFDDLWTVVLADGSKAKQAWTYRNSDIRFLDNATFGVGG
jgi:hypothetical protein